MPSKVTTILPVRVDRLLIARLDELRGLVPSSTRTALARDALRRGLELLEAQLKGQGEPKPAAPASPQEPSKLVRALDRLDSERGAPGKSRGARGASSQAKSRQRPQSAQVLDLFEAEPVRAGQGPSAAAPPVPDRGQSPSAAAPPAADLKEPAQGSLEKFASDVLDAAQHSPSGWVSSERLFISHAWRAYRKAYPSRPPALSVFKTLLLQARGKRLIELAEDEMAVFHRRADVQGSASESRGTRFHLLSVRRSLASWRKGR